MADLLQIDQLTAGYGEAVILHEVQDLAHRRDEP